MPACYSYGKCIKQGFNKSTVNPLMLGGNKKVKLNIYLSPMLKRLDQIMNIMLNEKNYLKYVITNVFLLLNAKWPAAIKHRVILIKRLHPIIQKHWIFEWASLIPIMLLVSHTFTFVYLLTSCGQEVVSKISTPWKASSRFTWLIRPSVSFLVKLQPP